MEKFKQLDKGSSIVLIDVENISNEYRQVELFGLNWNLMKDNFGNHPDIKINNGYKYPNIKKYDYSAILLSSSRIGHIDNILVDGNPQYVKNINFNLCDFKGRTLVTSRRPKIYSNDYFEIDGHQLNENVSISFDLAPNYKISLGFFKKEDGKKKIFGFL